jgi:hypothetical protein
MHIEEVRGAGPQWQEGNSYSALVLPEKKQADALSRVDFFVRQFRMCLDLVIENLRHEKAPYIYPTVEDLRRLAAEAKHYFVLDLLKGYFQIKLTEESKKHFCFACPLGKYRLNRLPMGGLNSSAHLQSCMDDLLGHLDGVGCYQDDVMGASATWEEHLQKLKDVLTKFEDMNLKLQLSKLVLWAKELVFVGHLFTESGVTADPEKVRAVLDMKRPETVGELYHFTCTTGFLRPYIINFAHRMKPLADYVTEALKNTPTRGLDGRGEETA